MGHAVVVVVGLGCSCSGVVVFVVLGGCRFVVVLVEVSVVVVFSCKWNLKG